jgi:SAM-dependent methyltransferase
MLQQQMMDRAQIKLASAEESAFPDTAFDVITAWDVLEHLDDPSGTIAKLKTWLAPGGALVFVVPVYDGPTGPIIRVLDKDPTHVQKRERGYWVELASEHFTTIEWHGVLRYLVGSSFYLHVPTQKFRSFTPAILVACSDNR